MRTSRAGRENAETIATGRGRRGGGRVHGRRAMPNTEPVHDSLAVTEGRTAATPGFPSGACTKAAPAELA